MVQIQAIDNYGNKANLDVLQEAQLLVDVSKIESQDIGQVFGISSQQFLLPGTDNNNQFFGNMFDIGVEGTIALQHSIYASVFVAEQAIFEGRLVVEEILKDDKGYVMYKATIVDEFVDFKLRIEDLRMRDLDMSAFDHQFNYGNLTGSWDLNTAGGNVVYPLVDYGYNSTTVVDYGGRGQTAFTNNNTPMPLDYWKPALKVKAVIDAVFNTVDYQYSSSFIEGDYFDKLYMLTTPDEQQGIPTQNPQDYHFEANFSGSTQTVADGGDVVVKFANELYDNGNNYNPVTGVFRIPADGNYYFAANAMVTWASPPGGTNLHRATARIEVNGVPQVSNPFYSTTTNGFLNVGQTLNNLSTGDEVTITLRNDTVDNINGNVVTGDSLEIGGPNGQVSFFSGQSFGALFAAQVDAALMFNPDLKVIDFLTDIITKFNLVVEPKKDNRKVLIMEPFNDWRESGAVKDWSVKVDNSVRKAIEGTMADNEEFVNFKDAEDNDFFNQYHLKTEGQVFGEALYVEGNSDLTRGTKDIEGEFFAPTPLFPIGGGQGDEVPHIYTQENVLGAYEGEPFDFKPRLFHYNGLKDFRYVNASSGSANAAVSQISWAHKGYWLEDDSGVPQAITQYPHFAHYEVDDDPAIIYPSEGIIYNYSSSRDLNWNNSNQRYFNNLYDLANGVPQTVNFVKRDAVYEYWAEYLNHLYHPDTKTVTLNIKFDPTDLPDIQLNDKIWIDGHYYRINNIKGFNLIDPKSTEVELITAPIRQFKFPVRRIYDIEGPSGNVGFNDITLDDGSINPDGSGIYVNVDDGLPPTGSGNQELVGKVAALDRFNYFPNDSGSVNIQTKINATNVSTGRNLVLGNSNKLASTVKNNIVQGSGNTIDTFNNNISLYGNNNSVSSHYNNDITVHGNNNTISGSVSDLHVFNVNNQTYTNLSESVLLSPTLDVENYESGRVVVGNLRRQGQQYENYRLLEAGPGETYDLSDGESGYFHYHLTYTSSVNGTTTVTLPDAALSSSKDIQFRFTTDGTLNASKKVSVVPSGSQTIDGGAETTLSEPYDGVTAQNIEGEWIVIQAKA